MPERSSTVSTEARPLQLARDREIVWIAIALTVGAEVFYFLVWGVYLFPEGNLFHKAVWTAACGVGMGAVIGAGVLPLVEGRAKEMAGLLQAAAVFATVSVACSFLCARIDASLSYFGGADHTVLFVLSGVLPAFPGAALYGWVLFFLKGNIND